MFFLGLMVSSSIKCWENEIGERLDSCMSLILYVKYHTWNIPGTLDAGGNCSQSPQCLFGFPGELVVSHRGLFQEHTELHNRHTHMHTYFKSLSFRYLRQGLPM
jgi:hypothetical protein